PCRITMAPAGWPSGACVLPRIASPPAPGMLHVLPLFTRLSSIIGPPPLGRHRCQAPVRPRSASAFKDHCMNFALPLVLALAAATPLAAQNTPAAPDAPVKGDDRARGHQTHPLLRTVDRIARQTPAIRGLEL